MTRSTRCRILRFADLPCGIIVYECQQLCACTHGKTSGRGDAAMANGRKEGGAGSVRA